MILITKVGFEWIKVLFEVRRKHTRVQRAVLFLLMVFFGLSCAELNGSMGALRNRRWFILVAQLFVALNTDKRILLQNSRIFATKLRIHVTLAWMVADGKKKTRITSFRYYTQNSGRKNTAIQRRNEKIYCVIIETRTCASLRARVCVSLL